MTVDAVPVPRFDELDSEGKIRKLDTELSFVKSELEQHRAILGQLLAGLAAMCECFPGHLTDIGAELRAQRFEIEREREPADPDFRRGVR
jgi:hypothetical protein